MNKPSLVIVVLEDDRHRMLIYKYLRQRGILRHQIRVAQSPSGSGSAEKWVRTQFVDEVSVYRSRQARTALIVIIDADATTVQERSNQLDEALTSSGECEVDETERIARLVPRRNVESWILCLNDITVDEETDYKNIAHDWTSLIRSASERLHRWSRIQSDIPASCLDSLNRGVKELKRLGI